MPVTAPHLPALRRALGYGSKWNSAPVLLKQTIYWGTLTHNLHSRIVTNTGKGKELRRTVIGELRYVR